MQQKKIKRLSRDSKVSMLASHLGQKVSKLASNRSQDTKSKIHLSSRDSYLREFKKPKIKLSTLSSIGSLGIEEQIKKQIISVTESLGECHPTLEQKRGNTKEELLTLEELIRFKDETIKALNLQIESLKKNDCIIEEDSPDSNREHDREPLFKLAEEMKHQREELNKTIAEHKDKYSNYLKIQKMIEEIEIKYTNMYEGRGRDPNYHGPTMMTYQEFKERQASKKEENTPNLNSKAKKVDFYHHLSPEKQTQPNRNMKDLITRKTITLAALKNSRKKHGVQMGELLAKLDFLKDEDGHLNQKIKEKEQELASMERKFSERRYVGNISRNPLLQFHS